MEEERIDTPKVGGVPLHFPLCRCRVCVPDFTAASSLSVEPMAELAATSVLNSFGLEELVSPPVVLGNGGD